MSPAAYPLPIQEGIRDLLGDLLGRSVDVQATHPPQYEADEIRVVADYVNDADEVATAVVASHEFSAYAGAALPMMPPSAAEDSIRRAVLPDNVLENVHEILNVASRLMQMEGSPHLRLRTITMVPGVELPADTAALVAAPTGRRDYVVTIDEYGEGRLSLLST